MSLTGLTHYFSHIVEWPLLVKYSFSRRLSYINRKLLTCTFYVYQYYWVFSWVNRGNSTVKTVGFHCICLMNICTYTCLHNFMLKNYCPMTSSAKWMRKPFNNLSKQLFLVSVRCNKRIGKCSSFLFTFPIKITIILTILFILFVEGSE